MRQILSILMLLLIAGFGTAMGQDAGAPAAGVAAEDEMDWTDHPDLYLLTDVQMYTVILEAPYRDPDAIIYYRIQFNEGELTEWMLYEEPLVFTEYGTYMVEAYAIAEGKSESVTCAVMFTLDENTGGAPASAPNVIIEYSEDWTHATVSMNADEGADIYYRINGGDYCEYYAPLYFSTAGDYTIDAYAFGPRPDYRDSEVVTVDFTIVELVLEPTAAPAIYAESGQQSYTVTIEPPVEDPDAWIVYRIQLDQYEWTEWTPYCDPIELTEYGAYKVEAYAIAEGKRASDIVSVTFEIDEYTGATPPPSIRAVAGNKYYTVVVTKPEEAIDMAYHLYYRFKLEDSDSGWTEWYDYTLSPVVFTEFGTYTVEAMAHIEGMLLSRPVSVNFTLDENTFGIADTPVIIVDSDSTSVTFDITAEEGATIYYSFNGVDYDIYTPDYYDPFEFNQPGTYCIYAYAEGPYGKARSDVAYAEYTLPDYSIVYAECPEIEAISGNQCYNVVITSRESDPYAEVYYRFSVNNSEWTDWSLYTEPLLFKEFGTYTVEAFAKVYEKSPSESVSVSFTFDENTRPYVPGDVNGDGEVSPVDITALIDYLLGNSTAPVNERNADTSGDGVVNPLDITVLIDLLFAGEPIQHSETFTVNGVSFTMVSVAGGTFTMGATMDQGDYSERSLSTPIHQVTLSGFSIGQTEVTQELWEAVMGSNPSHFTGNLQRPVEHANWDDCQEFIAKLNELTGRNFRMPTEAEWEFAARGGIMSRHSRYAGSENIEDVAWYIDNAYRVGYDSPDYGTHPVATKAPNELGLYDMSGNVWEWCQDWYGIYPNTAQINPTGPSKGDIHILRGGCWGADSYEYCIVSSRYLYYLWFVYGGYYGLRLAL